MGDEGGGTLRDTDDNDDEAAEGEVVARTNQDRRRRAKSLDDRIARRKTKNASVNSSQASNPSRSTKKSGKTRSPLRKITEVDFEDGIESKEGGVDEDSGSSSSDSSSSEEEGSARRGRERRAVGKKGKESKQARSRKGKKRKGGSKEKSDRPGRAGYRSHESADLSRSDGDLGAPEQIAKGDDKTSRSRSVSVRRKPSRVP